MRQGSCLHLWRILFRLSLHGTTLPSGLHCTLGSDKFYKSTASTIRFLPQRCSLPKGTSKIALSVHQLQRVVRHSKSKSQKSQLSSSERVVLIFGGTVSVCVGILRLVSVHPFLTFLCSTVMRRTHRVSGRCDAESYVALRLLFLKCCL